MKLKILFLGKLPPIQGGVSSQNLSTLNSLVLKGHEIYVVSNAQEVEPNYRQVWFGDDKHVLDDLLNGAKYGQLQPVKENSYVPWAAPYTTQLLGASIEILSSTKIDLIYASYFEPYGVVGGILAKDFKVPLFVRHAGSDLGKLSMNTNLASTYRYFLSTASAIFTNRKSISVVERLDALLTDDAPRISLLPSTLPPYFFSSTGRLNIELVDQATKDLIPVLPESNFSRCLNHGLQSRFREDSPTIGFYGKVGDVKGTLVLLRSLQRLAASSLEFNVLGLIGGREDQLAAVADLLDSDPELASRCKLMPFVAPWRIPQFLARCDVVCCLENNFPIAFHAPRMAREAFAAGKCVLLSSEATDRLAFGNSISNENNALVVSASKFEDDLISALSYAIRDKSERERIATHGRLLSNTYESGLSKSDSISDAIEDLAVELLEMKLSK